MNTASTCTAPDLGLALILAAFTHRTSLTSGLNVRYECSCGHSWSETWSTACDEECDSCGSTVEAAEFELDGTIHEDLLDAYNLGKGPSEITAIAQRLAAIEDGVPVSH
jgi:hypothetical protein